MGTKHLKNIFESLIVFAVMTGILLPARLLFVEFVTDDWLGSFGVISALSAFVIILAKKQKLGSFGLMFERQLYRFQKGRRGLVVFGESVFLLLILGGMIFAIDQGNTVYSELAVLSQNSSSMPSSKILEPTNDWHASDWFVAFLMIPAALLTAFPQMSATIASIDQMLDGWLLHFYTVGFVEYIELLGILIFYKISFRKKVESSVESTIYSKTPP